MGSISRKFRAHGVSVTANDILRFCYVINYTNIVLDKNPFGLESGEVFEYLDTLPLIDTGFIFNNYCLGGKENTEYGRMYFTDRNGKYCDTVREEIGRLYKGNHINEDQYNYLLACLLYAAEKSANTTGVYSAYLKHFKRSSLQPIKINPLPITSCTNVGIVRQDDANKLVREIDTDILYLDPPYNSRQYATNYHLLDTIVKYDNPKLKGKTGLRVDTKDNKSEYCSKSNAYKAMEDLLDNTNAKYIVISYNNEGILNRDELLNLLGCYGDTNVIDNKYRRYKSNSNKVTHNYTIESIYTVVRK